MWKNVQTDSSVRSLGSVSLIRNPDVSVFHVAWESRQPDMMHVSECSLGSVGEAFPHEPKLSTQLSGDVCLHSASLLQNGSISLVLESEAVFQTSSARSLLY